MNSNTVTFDPSLTCTGYAAGDRHSAAALLHEAGKIGRMTEAQRRASNIEQRCRLIYDDALDVLRRRRPLVIVIETPAPQGPKLGAAGQAKYGMSVGVVLAAAWVYKHEQLSLDNTQIITTDSDDWTHQVPKADRQLAVIQEFSEYDPKQDSGLNIADAIGLLTWWAAREWHSN